MKQKERGALRNKSRILELVIYLAILITVILLATFGKIPKPNKIVIPQTDMKPIITERVQ